MVYSYVTYTGDDSTVTFTIPFTYLSTSHLLVEIDGEEYTGSLTFPTASQVTLDTAPALDATIKIQRKTPHQRLVNFTSGNTISSKDLNTDSLQLSYVVEELLDITDDYRTTVLDQIALMQTMQELFFDMILDLVPDILE